MPLSLFRNVFFLTEEFFLTLIKIKFTLYLLGYQGHDYVSPVSTCFGTNFVVTIPAVTNALHNLIGLVFVLYKRFYRKFQPKNFLRNTRGPFV